MFSLPITTAGVVALSAGRALAWGNLGHETVG